MTQLLKTKIVNRHLKDNQFIPVLDGNLAQVHRNVMVGDFVAYQNPVTLNCLPEVLKVYEVRTVQQPKEQKRSPKTKLNNTVKVQLLVKQSNQPQPFLIDSDYWLLPRIADVIKINSALWQQWQMLCNNKQHFEMTMHEMEWLLKEPKLLHSFSWVDGLATIIAPNPNCIGIREHLTVPYLALNFAD